MGVIRRGTGRYARNVILTNSSGRPCTLAGGPSEITGVRRNGRRVRLVTGATPGVSVDYRLVGPANLRPGQSAQVVIQTATMCKKAIAGRVDIFVTLDIGIAHSGEVRIGFPPGLPYDAVCGVSVTTYGISKHK